MSLREVLRSKNCGIKEEKKMAEVKKEREHTPKQSIGLFVSDNELSGYVYKKLKDKGINVFSFSFVSGGSVHTQVFQPGDIKGILSYLKKQEITKLAFIGRVPAEIVFKDIHSSSDIFLQGEEPLSGEGILKKIIAFLETENIEVMPLTEILQEELAEKKTYTETSLNKTEANDVNTGVHLLSDIMKYRIGQSVAVKQGMIIAVEGVEGTDEMIRRAGMYCNAFAVVKTAGKDKDERFDIPVIGPRTIEVLKEAGGRVLAIEAGKTIIFDIAKTINLCNKNKITLIGI